MNEYSIYAVVSNGDELSLTAKSTDLDSIKKRYNEIAEILSNNLCRILSIDDMGYMIPVASILYVYIKEESHSLHLFDKPTHRGE